MTAQNPPSITAIIGHADEPALLEACIAHHLSVGADRLFVSVNRDQPGLDRILAGDERVRTLQASSLPEEDAFHYFTHAVRQAESWGTPDWVFFTDTDEFWLPRGGDMRRIDGLGTTDLYIVERFNAFPQIGDDGVVTPPDTRAPYSQPMILAREWLEDRYLGGDHRLPWIFGIDAPKLLVRPALVASVGPGGHNITASPGSAAIRWSMPEDLAILHAPFTTASRFKHKIAGVRRVLQHHADHFNARQAWHWRYWLALGDDDLEAEFRRQALPARSIPILLRDAVVGTASDLYPELRHVAARPSGDALREMLERVMTNHRDGMSAPASLP